MYTHTCLKKENETKKPNKPNKPNNYFFQTFPSQDLKTKNNLKISYTEGAWPQTE